MVPHETQIETIMHVHQIISIGIARILEINWISIGSECDQGILMKYLDEISCLCKNGQILD
jgi:uncharacterized membrane protein